MVEQKEELLQKIRGKDISMIFQEPSAALDPVYTIGDQIAEEYYIIEKWRCIREP